jgi:DNA-directed RNA polymerase subunit RPC12/RpoP
MKRWKALLLAHCIASYIVLLVFFLVAVFAGNAGGVLLRFFGILVIAPVTIFLFLSPGVMIYYIVLFLGTWLVYVVSILVGYQVLKPRPIRTIRGICMKCGYDLRASKDRCPECGTKVPALVRWVNDEAEKDA